MGRGDYKRDINIRKSFEALGDAKSQALVGFYGFADCDQNGKLMIIQNRRAGTHLLHLLKRLSILLRYLVILSNIQRKNVLMA